MLDLGTLGGRSSYGMSVNASNHVVGYSMINGSDNRIHAFFYNGETMLDLGSLENEGFGDYSAAMSVNNDDQVVGFNYLPTGSKGHFNQTAFVWHRTDKGGEMLNLNKLIAGWSSRYWLLSATAINDHGQIAATAYDYANGTIRAVLLTATK
jgi:probable HAF family extracellular repeat protein